MCSRRQCAIPGPEGSDEPFTPEYDISSPWSFTSNEQPCISNAMRGRIQCLLLRRRWRRVPLIVGADGSHFGPLQTRIAAAVIQGRGILSLRASYDQTGKPRQSRKRS